MNKAYQELIKARVRKVINEAQGLRLIDHSGLQGELKEMLVRDLFRPLFPADIGVGTGIIVTASNQQSGQQDIVIYDKKIIPPILLENSSGLFPVESVLFTIEIKSTLTATELRNTHEKTKTIKNFQLISGIYSNDDDTPIPHTYKKSISCLFAFSTDLVNKGETERYDEIRGDEEPSIDIIRVIGSGLWRWRPVKNSWREEKGEYPNWEVINFIARILNSYRDISITRGEPRIGYYLL